MKAVFKYPGSKWGIADWIISHFPDHHSYLEPYFGSGAVLFNKPRSDIETVNDLDDNVTNLFSWIQRDPERLAHAIYWTPYARAAYEEATTTSPKDSLQKAVYFFVKLSQGHGYRTNERRVGWKSDIQGREKAYAARDWAQAPERIIQAAERLRGVQIENKPAIELIPRYNYSNVLIYADPPYVLSTRHGKQYRMEMDDRQQEDMLDVLLAHKGPVLLSGYDNDLYNDRFRGWYREETASQNMHAAKTQEILWMNFEPQRQMNLTDYENKEEPHHV